MEVSTNYTVTALLSLLVVLALGATACKIINPNCDLQSKDSFLEFKEILENCNKNGNCNDFKHNKLMNGHSIILKSEGKSSEITLMCGSRVGKKELLAYLGSHSGSSVNKMQVAGLTPYTTDLGNVAFEEAELVYECRKLHHQDIDPSKFLTEIEVNYPNKDYHRLYIGEITTCLQRT